MPILVDPVQVSMRSALRCDLFCTVIDNYGDAGVCWRLARQLASEYGWAVRLYIDQPSVLAALLPALAPHLRSLDNRHTAIDGVDIQPWPVAGRRSDGDGDASHAPDDALADAPKPAPERDAADVVIEAFACELPDFYLRAMAALAAHGRAPAWINLDYLSAEDWVRDCHLGRSRHPRLPLEKTFFFPGVGKGTGGLLRERDLDAQRAAFLHDPAAQTAVWQRLGLPSPSHDTRVITLFGYENPALDALLPQWADSDIPILLLIPEGRISAQVGRYFGQDDFPAMRAERKGRLSAVSIPFVDQPTYDRLLWLADLNFVRGEESFVRAQWAERPSVWQIYPQSDDVHLDKLDAMLRHYAGDLPEPAQAAVTRFWRAWNGVGTPDWPDFQQHHETLMRYAPQWVDVLRKPGSLAANLAGLAKSRLK